MPVIPKNIHFIWLGGSIPDTSAENVLIWKQKNPDYTVKLWYDSMHMLAGRLRKKIANRVEREAADLTLGIPGDRNAAKQKLSQVLLQKEPAVYGGDDARLDFLASMTGKDQEHYRLKKLGASFNFGVLRSAGVQVIDARTIMPASRMADIYEKELAERNVNFGAASDLLRYEILYQHGGIYADVDIACLKPFGDIAIDDDNLVLWGLYDGRICNALIACCPRSSMMRQARRVILLKYDQVRTSGELREFYNNNVRRTTINMTGPTIASQSIEKTFAKRNDIRISLPFVGGMTSPEMRDHERELDDFSRRCTFPEGFVDFEARPEAKVHKWLVANADKAVQAAAGAH